MKPTSELWQLICLCLFITACHVSKSTQSAMSAFDTQGHRGCRGLMPENTIPAMEKALQIGVTTLEMDAMITKDEKVILSHDPYFSSMITTRADGSFVTPSDEKKLAIFAMTFADTQLFDVGMKPHAGFPRQQKLPVHKPLLTDVIDSAESFCLKAQRARPFYNIETKCNPASDNALHPSPEKFVDLIMSVVNEKRVTERVIIQSFDFRTLIVMHRKYPSIKTAALIQSADKRSVEDQLKALGFIPAIYSPEASLVTRELIATCHEKKMKVIPWTVNDKTKIDLFKGMGVDGIISDYPDLF